MKKATLLTIVLLPLIMVFSDCGGNNSLSRQAEDKITDTTSSLGLENERNERRDTNYEQ